ncbi:DNA adenine methylase [Evansella tamaricis]|uniref:DNA adenine methylase n=1 Tax=Evansella tamaricis TaxID=2069301 RepID=A0ABS6JKA5_9BACI|nr:DNA adenine methylase [Evansella tamaricis]MBU9714124.1 DNA adenine methylase [Evansella tamaricis]
MINPSPLRYPGGKFKTYNYIKSIIETNQCTSYIEPFAGGAAVGISLLINDDVERVIINDFDRSIYAFWHSVIYNSEELISRINNTSITIEEREKQKKIQIDKQSSDLIDLGFSTLFLNRVNRSGIIKGGVIGGKNQDGKYKLDCRFNKDKLIKKIRLIASKQDRIDVYNQNALDFIGNVIIGEEQSFTFFDPPYYDKGPSLYTNFYSHEDHRELAETIINNLQDYFWIVTYDHSTEIKALYSELNSVEYYLNYSAQEKTKGVEYMFFSVNTNTSRPNHYLNLFG